MKFVSAKNCYEIGKLQRKYLKQICQYFSLWVFRIKCFNFGYIAVEKGFHCDIFQETLYSEKKSIINVLVENFFV